MTLRVYEAPRVHVNSQGKLRWVPWPFLSQFLWPEGEVLTS